ncbi:MAG TPA: aspartate/glutamate racemase family protein [Atribacterota bacterium]|nr:aspartate/glutamate racemase family protein [Atribacterota bacterium]
MSTPIITMIHTVFPIVDSLKAIFAKKLGNQSVTIYNIVDDSILPRIVAAGGLSSGIISTVYQHISSAEKMGSDLILVTCSSISEVVDIVSPLVSVPVIKIDDAMTDEAVKVAVDSLGVIATIKTTLNPTINQLKKKMVKTGKKFKIVPVLCSDAYKALINEGNPEKHDLLLYKGIEKIIEDVDAIVLAQASMARLLPKLRKLTNKPILTSPESGVERAINILSKSMC